MKTNDKDPPLRNTFCFVNPLYLIIHYHSMDVNYYSVQYKLDLYVAFYSVFQCLTRKEKLYISWHSDW